MVKAVREYDVVLSDAEVKLVNNVYRQAIRNIVKGYFIDKGMTPDQVEEKFVFGDIVEDIVFGYLEDGVTQAHAIEGIVVKIEEKVD